MNRRNLQIFGWRALPNKSLFLLAIILVLGGALYAMTSSLKQGSITGATAIDIPEETTAVTQESTGAQPSSSSEITGQVITQPVTPVEEPPSEPDYTAFSGDCAFSIKQAEDNVADLDSVLQEVEQRLDALTKELEEKTQALDNQYFPQMDTINEEIEKTASLIKEAQKKLSSLKSSCQPDQPNIP